MNLWGSLATSPESIRMRAVDAAVVCNTGIRVSIRVIIRVIIGDNFKKMEAAHILQIERKFKNNAFCRQNPLVFRI